MEETRRNLADYAPEVFPTLEINFVSIDFDIVAPSKEEVMAASRLVALKDAPILPAAKVAQVDYLVTLDKKHLLDRPELESRPSSHSRAGGGVSADHRFK
jgi:hypothetical protein